MPKRLGNTQIPSAAGLSDIINLKQHKQYVEQDIFPSPENDVLNGLRFDGSSYLSRTPTTAGNQTTWTWSSWVKFGSLTETLPRLFSAGTAETNRTEIYFNTNTNQIIFLNKIGGPVLGYVNTVAYLRDASAWYHLVLFFDASSTTLTVYINGVQQTLTTTTAITNVNSMVNGANAHSIGRYWDGGSNFNGYLANIHFIDGQALDPSHFGYYNRSSRQWKPKKYTGTYGGNGFYLPFNTDVYRYFNGAASVNLSGSPITTFPCTVSCWVNLNDVGGTYGQVINLNVGGTRASIFYNYNDNGSFTGDQASTFVICIGLQNHFSTENLRTYPNSGWHHLAVVFKSGTNVTPDVYIDGEFVSATNRGLSHGGTGVNAIGSNGSSAEYLSGYITNVAYFDNYTITQEEVTEIFNSGLDGDLTELSITQPNSYLKLNEKTGTTVAATLGTITGTATNSMITNSLDFSGNHNDWTPIGFSGHDTVPDSPQNTFATLNPLIVRGTTTSGTWAQDGNLKALSDASASMVVFSTMSFSTRKYYTEFLVVNTVESNDHVGIAFDSVVNDTISVVADGGTCVAYKASGQKIIDGSLSNYGDPYTDGNLIGVFVDLDNNEVTFYKEGISQGTITGVISGTYLHRVRFNNVASQQSQCIVNFGQDPTFGGAKSPATTYTDANGIGAFYYQPPDGALALCTANLPRSVIEDPADYFKAVTYSGDETVGVSKDLGFRPDMIWAKARNIDYNHILIDSLRPHSDADSYYRLHTDAVNSQADYNDNIYITNNGFNCYPRQSGVNENNKTFVAWCWKAGGTPTGGFTGTEAMVDGVETTCSALALSAGASITPTAMSVNTDAGFSIVKYGGSNTTGLLSSSVSSATIPHGLNDCEFCIIKNIRWSNTWVVSHRSIAPNVMSLQDTGQAASTPPVDPAYGQITTLGSNTVTITRGSTRGDNVGEDLDAGGGQFEYIMYCWHSVEGFSKFGSYTGNNSADGPFVYTGFRPAWVMIKKTNGAATWWIVDSSRDEYNPTKKYLQADSANAESAGSSDYVTADFVSNGFKIRNTSVSFNSGNHIFMAFAEQPFNFTNSR